jgi:3',5'-cyclic-AMP phosphodiesterase
MKSKLSATEMIKEEQYSRFVSLRNWSLHFIAIFLSLQFTFALTAAEAQKTLTDQLSALEKIHRSFTFAVIGDNKTGKGDDNIYRDLITQAMKHNPDFIVNTGDMISSPRSKYWDRFKELSKAVSVPYFFTMGNHDLSDKASEALYRKETDLPGNGFYYSFDAGGSLFVVLDSKLPGENKKITDEQYKWLQKVLSNPDYKHKFAFVHHPLFPEKGRGHHYEGSLDKYPKERDRLQSLFVKHNVDIVFQGHEHIYLRKTVDGVMHIITGGGGAPLYADNDNGGFHHFILVTVEGETVSGRVIDDKGQLRDTFSIRK